MSDRDIEQVAAAAADGLWEQIVLALCIDHGHINRPGALACSTCNRRARLLLPVVRAYAAAQVAAEQGRIAAAHAVWLEHYKATPLGLPCECVGCRMGRALDGAP